MDVSKHSEFFDPISFDKAIHVVGVGAVGSSVVELLARLGIEEIHIYDFDKVEPKNIANQMFFHSQIGMTKCDAVEATALSINPDIRIKKHTEGWKPGTFLKGYVFLCVDSIKIRQAIVNENKYNPNIIAMFDFRMRLKDAQHYAADWSNQAMITNLQATMDFSDDEAKAATELSACGTTLSVAPTVREVVTLGVANFMNFYLTGKIKKLILVEPFNAVVDAF